jgi:hypothetical protein
MSHSSDLTPVLEEILALLTAEAVDLGMPAPVVEDGEITCMLDDRRYLGAASSGAGPSAMVFVGCPLWPVDRIDADELRSLIADMGADSPFSIEVNDYSEETEEQVDLWFGLMAEMPNDDAVNGAAGSLTFATELIARSEERLRPLASADADRLYVAQLAASSCIMAVIAREQEPNEERAARMAIILEEKQELLVDTFADLLDMDSDVSAIDELLADVAEYESYLLLVDCAFSEPFAPYDVAIDHSQRRSGIEEVAAQLGLPDDERLAALFTVREFELGQQSSLRETSTTKVVVGLGALALVSVVLTPAGAAALGGVGAGLTGAAATAHGLALLGGGSIAAGGLGMAGGLWVLGAAGVAGGALAAGGLVDITAASGPAAARFELAKGATTLAWLSFGDEDALNDAIAALESNYNFAADKLSAQRERSDPDSKLIKDLEELLVAIDRALASVQSPGYSPKDQAFRWAERFKDSSKHAGKRVRRAFS